MASSKNNKTASKNFNNWKKQNVSKIRSLKEDSNNFGKYLDDTFCNLYDAQKQGDKVTMDSNLN